MSAEYVSQFRQYDPNVSDDMIRHYHSRFPSVEDGLQAYWLEVIIVCDCT